MEQQERIWDLLKFIEESPSCFHVIRTMEERLAAAGCIRLKENETWKLIPGKSYYVTRNQSSMIAFSIPEEGFAGFHIIASHSDSPAFKLKENPEMEGGNAYIRLNTEKYGGMLMAPWFDRPLSIAGRVAAAVGDRIESRLLSVNRDLVLIPSLAIHMNRKANDGYSYNPQTDLLPLFGSLGSGGSLKKIIAAEAKVAEEQILATDLFLYNRVRGTVWGADHEFISSARLDDLECVYGSMEGFLSGENPKYAMVHAVFDNEETGSVTKQGAASPFLVDTLQRIAVSCGQGVRFPELLSGSFMLSADNAHGVHPNQPEKSDPVNRPVLNGGVVIKFSANQKYTTDSLSGAVVLAICKKKKIPWQLFFNRSDMQGGSTLGNIASGHTAIPTADVGLAQLAMHSPYETAGAKDVDAFIRLAEAFYRSDLRMEDDGVFYAADMDA